MNEQTFVFAYHRRRADGALYAVRTTDERPDRAIGPLPDAQLVTPPALLDFGAGVDATGWALEDFDRIGREYGAAAHPHERFPARAEMRETADRFSTRIRPQTRE